VNLASATSDSSQPIAAGCNSTLDRCQHASPSTLHCQSGWSSECANMDAALIRLHRHWKTGRDKISLGRRAQPADIHRRMLAQYGSVKCMSQRKVYERIARFKSGIMRVTKLDPGTRQRCAVTETPIVLTLSYDRTDGLLCVEFPIC
jgi:hypothetical protein